MYKLLSSWINQNTSHCYTLTNIIYLCMYFYNKGYSKYINIIIINQSFIDNIAFLFLKEYVHPKDY